MDYGFPSADFSVASHFDEKAGKTFHACLAGMLANNKANATDNLRHNICQTVCINCQPGQRLHTDRTY
jgi:hypothetical protein